MTNSPVPKLTVKGNAYERGYQHGAQARQQVRAGVDFYTRMWEENIGRSRADLLALAGEFGPVVGDFDAAILEEIEGVAAGADLQVEEVLLVNARYELMLAALFKEEQGDRPGECTSLAAGPAATVDGHTLIAQNWDWTLEARGRSILLEIQQEDRPDILTHIEAGFMGHKGMNTAGLGLCANAMSSQRDRFDPAVPVWVLARTVLNCNSLDEARAELARAMRVASVNFTVAARGGEVAAIEVSPVDVRTVPATDDRVSHANVFADLSAERGLEDRLAVLYPQFCERARHAAELAGAGEVSVERLKEVLSDHGNRPESICRHHKDQPDDAPAAVVLHTIASVVMDLDEGVLHIAEGPPCETQFTEHRLARAEHVGA